MEKTKLYKLKFCLITQIDHSKPFSDYLSFLKKTAEGGVTMVQLRDKELSFDELIAKGLLVKELLSEFSIPLIINDDVNLAKEIDADGVHLGQDDMHPDEARAILGKNKIIGFSIENLDELALGNKLSTIDYVAASAVYRSKTKPDCKMIWGTDGIKQFVLRSRHPAITIGGISYDNIKTVMATGVVGVAISGYIHDADDPKLASSLIISEINNFYETKEYHAQ